jgi:outer membrane lipoprotein-sorting protein
MVPDTALPRVCRFRRARRATALTAIGLSATLALTGCLGSIGKVVNAVHAAVDAAKNMKDLESQIEKGENASFVATYTQTGSGQSASTATFAQEKGGKYAYIVPESSGTSGTEFIANGKDTWTCTQASSGATWQCVQQAENLADGDAAFPFYAYTGAYVVTLIDAASVVAALSGFTVKNFNSSVHGISLKCVSLSGKNNGQTENDEWCTTSDGIVGLVKETSSDSSDNSSFEITSLSKSPSSSLFQPPKGATVTQQSS